MASAQQQDTTTTTRRNPRRRKAIQLSDQESHELADELADLDEDEQHEIKSTAVSGWSQNLIRGTPIRSRTSSCQTWK